MSEHSELLKHIGQLHTTKLGVGRIKRNLSLNTEDVIAWCKVKIGSDDAVVTRKGKNWYVNVDGCMITINVYSDTVITAHKINDQLKRPGGVPMSEKYTFHDFLNAVDAENQKFVSDLHNELTGLGCKIEVKLAKSGYVVSYSLNKKTIANYVFRKKGLIARIYANHIVQYMEILDTLPDGMVRTIQEAPVCKRLVDPSTCNQRCSMGYDFILKGERMQKCRNGAFMFLLSEENKPFIKALLLNEAKASV